MRILVALSAAALACAQGTTPKPSAAEYPVHGEARGIGIGAEYMVHSFGGGEQMYVVENYLVVEVALYPPKEAKIAPDPGQFALRINGKKTALMPQPPAMVAASLSHPEWQQPPRATADGGAGRNRPRPGRQARRSPGADGAASGRSSRTGQRVSLFSVHGEDGLDQIAGIIVGRLYLKIAVIE